MQFKSRSENAVSFIINELKGCSLVREDCVELELRRECFQVAQLHKSAYRRTAVSEGGES